METIYRVLHPETRIVDAPKGIVDYVASDETIDSFKEIIRADGWRFTNFQKNAPFVDSHDTSTVAKLVGKVIDFRVAGGALIERVQWAVDVAENELAQLGFKMTQAGYLKAVSVGFFPVTYLTPNSQGWSDALKELRLPADAEVRTIYTQQEQVELSACVLGANPNALAKARSDGLISDTHLDKFPQLRRKIEKSQGSGRPAFSFPATATKSTSSREDFMNKLNIFTRHSGVPATSKAGFDRLESLRANGTDDEINCAFSQARSAAAGEHRDGPDAIDKYLNQPGVREFWNALGRYMRRRIIPKEQAKFLDTMRVNSPADWPRHLVSVNKDLGVAPVSGGEAFLVAEGFSEQLFDLLYSYGAFKTLGLRTLAKNYTKFSKTTGRPGASFITPTMTVGTQIPDDTTFAGAQLLPLANMVASLVKISLQLIEDSEVDLSRVMVENFTQGLSSRIDYACFQGSGANDANNGGQTGIFMDATIPAAVANQGETLIEQLSRQSFLNAVAAVAPATLQRACRWWIQPSLLPALARLAEGSGAYWLLKSPSETTDGTWNLVGFPVEWSAQAPVPVDGPGQKIAAFGWGDSYLVNLSEEFIIESSEHFKWNTLQAVYRAWARVYCETREATGLSTLSTAQK